MKSKTLSRKKTSSSPPTRRSKTAWATQILRLSVALALTVATVASGQSYKVLKNFTGSDGARPFAEVVLGGSVPAVHLTGGIGSFVRLEYADSFAAPQWSSLSNLTLSGGPQCCFDLCQPMPTQRFYRAWQTNGMKPSLDASMATEIPLTGAIGSSVRVDYINQFGPTDAWVTLGTVTLTKTRRSFISTRL
jgi:hypothetical protein